MLDETSSTFAVHGEIKAALQTAKKQHNDLTKSIVVVRYELTQAGVPRKLLDNLVVKDASADELIEFFKLRLEAESHQPEAVHPTPSSDEEDEDVSTQVHFGSFTFDPEGELLGDDKELLSEFELEYKDIVEIVSTYDPQVSLLKYEEMFQGRSFSYYPLMRAFADAHFPHHIARPLAKAISGSNPRFKQLMEMRSRRDANIAKPKTKASHSVVKWTAPKPTKFMGKTPLYWQPPVYMGAARYPKPPARGLLVGGLYHRRFFRLWLDGAVAALAALARKATEKVVAPDVFKALYQGSFKGTVAQLESILFHDPVLIDFSKESHAMSSHTWQLSLTSKHRSLPVMGFTITSAAYLASLEHIFKRHKPLHRLGVHYLSGALMSDFDVQRLTAEYLKHFPVTPVTAPLPDYYLDFPPPGAIQKQGQAFSIPSTISVEHTVHTPEMTAFLQGLKDLMVDMPHDYTRPFVQIVSFALALHKSVDWVGATAVCLQFIAGNDFLWKMTSRVLSSVTNPPRILQSGMLMQRLGEMRDWVGFSEFWTAAVAFISTLVTDLVASVTTPLHGAIYSLLSETRVSLLRESGKTLAQSILAGVTEVITRIRRCVIERSLTPIWGVMWDPRRWVVDVESMITYYPLLTGNGSDDASAKLRILRESQKLPSWWISQVTIGEFIDRGEVYYSQGVDLAQAFSKNVNLSREIALVARRLRVFLDDLIGQKAISTRRMVPFFVLLWGVAGGGKTNIAETISHAIANINGYDHSGIYDWQDAVNFQDGLNHTQWCVRMDDVDQGVAADQAGVRNHVQNVIAMINNNPFPVEAAQVEMKGKIRASPHLVTYTTNFENCNLLGHTLQPTAFWRRVNVRVRVEAKPEFSAGNGILDKKKAAQSKEHDMFNLYVSMFDANLVDKDDIWVLPFGPEKLMSLSDLMTLIHKLYKEHIESERTRLCDPQLGVFCDQCGMNLATKKCSHVRQGKIAEAFASLCAEIAVEVIQPSSFKFRFLTEVAAMAGVYMLVPQAQKAWFYLKDKTQTSVERIERLVSAGYVPEVLAEFAKGAVALTLVTAGLSYTFSYVLQGRELNTTTGLVAKDWYRADQTFTPGIPPSGLGATFTKEDLNRAIVQSHVSIPGGHATIISQNLLLAPTHLAPLGEILSIVTPEKTIKVHLTGLNSRVLPSNKEVTLIRCGEIKGLPGLAGKIWSHDDQSITSFDEIEIWSDQLEYTTTANKRFFMPIGNVWQVELETKPGDCGQIYVARFGKSWHVIGMHYQLVFGKGQCAIITRQELQKVSSQLATTLQGVETPLKMMSKTPMAIEMQPYPLKSEVWAAISHHGASVYSFGELWPPMAGSSMKTKMEVALIAPDMDALATEWCGESNYWRFPEFRGKQIDGKWVSPFTNAFASENKGTPNETVLWIAIADYLHGLEDLDHSGYSTLSEQQVVTGIPGSYIKAANLKTSVGPPFNQNKRHHIQRVDDDVFFSPQFCEIYDELKHILEQGGIPSPIGLCTLKDEPLKPGKMPRVFTVFPAAFNFLLKEYLAAVKSFIRANPTFFESAVGVDMTSHFAMIFVVHLQTVDPTLTNLRDSDVKQLDKSFFGRIFDAIALVNYAIAWTIGVGPEKVYTLCLGLKHTKFYIKGDVFSTWWNGSGHDATVEFNGEFMSLSYRYYYFLKRLSMFEPHLPDLREWISTFFENPIPRGEWVALLDFRVHNALVTYGDDVLRSIDYDEDGDIVEVFYEHLGLTLTDANKGTTLQRKTIFDVDFLKRAFVWSDEFQRYITPISKKSLARMLVIKRESTLTSRDHAAHNMTNVMRELVYHGKAEYDRFAQLAWDVASKHALTDNPNFVYKPYEYWAQKVHEKTFSTWEAPFSGKYVNPNDCESRQ